MRTPKCSTDERTSAFLSAAMSCRPATCSNTLKEQRKFGVISFTMVFSEEFADEMEVRPGRRLFVRKVLIGSTESTKPAALHLICAHGTCATEKQYQLLLEAIDPLVKFGKISCLLFDNIGCGQSPSLKDWKTYENNEIRADLEAVILNHADPSLPTVLIGHSYAPSIFLPLLKEKPKLIPKLAACILMSTSVRQEHLTQRDGGHPIMRLPVAVLSCLQTQLTEAFLHIALHPDHVELKQAVRDDSNRNDMAVAKAYHRQMEWAKAEDLEGILHVPTLIIHGADDGVIPVACGQHLQNTLPKSELIVIDRARHLVMVEQPDQTAKEVYAFLEKLL